MHETNAKKWSGSIACKLLCVVLAAVMLIPLFATGTKVSSMENPGRIDGVDYNRVRENKDLSIPIYFTLGSVKFDGELVNGSTLTNKEIDKIVKQVMNEMDITSGVLEYSNSIIEKSKHLKGFDPAMALRIGLSIAGYGTVADLYDMYTGAKPVSTVTANFVIGQLSGEAVKLITGAKWADIALNAFLATEDIANEWTRLEKEKEIAEEALRRELLLDMFYKECNARLKKAEKERGGNSWKMRVNSVTLKRTTLFGVDVVQYLKLEANLERVDSFGDNTSTNWSGIYEGSIKLKIWHDLTSFDHNFPTIFTNSSPIFAKVKTIYALRPESAEEKSTLTKLITLDDAQIHIDKRNAVGTTLSKSVPLTGANDVSAFNLSHTVSLALDFGPWDDGIFEASGSGVKYRAEVSMKDKCSGTMLEGNRYPAIVWDSHENVAFDSLSAPQGVGWTQRKLAGDGKTNIGSPALADYQIYSDLRENMLTLWIKNIEKVNGK